MTVDSFFFMLSLKTLQRHKIIKDITKLLTFYKVINIKLESTFICTITVGFTANAVPHASRVSSAYQREVIQTSMRCIIWKGHPAPHVDDFQSQLCSPLTNWDYSWYICV